MITVIRRPGVFGSPARRSRCPSPPAGPPGAGRAGGARAGAAAAALLLAAAFPAAAQEAAPAGPVPLRLSQDQAVELAVQNNLGLESQRVALDTKKRKSDLVWNQFLPTISVSGTMSRANKQTSGTTLIPVDVNKLLASIPEGTIYGVVPYPYDVPQWSVSGSLQASLSLSLALVEGIRAVRQDYQAGLVTLEKLRAQTERDVRKQYFTILQTQDAVALLQESLAGARRRYEMAQTNYNAGMSPRLTVLQAQVQMRNLEPSLIDGENSISLLMSQLAMSLGLPLDSRFELDPLVWANATDQFGIPLNLEELITRAASSKPDILDLQASLAVLNTQRKAQALQLRTPTLSLSWGLAPVFAGDPWKDTWFDGDHWTESGRFSISLALSLNTLFPFTKEGQSLADLDNQIKTLSIALAQTAQGTELEIYKIVNTLEKTRVSWETQAQTVALAEESYRLTETAYNAGLQDSSQVQDAADSLDQAKGQLLTQQYTYLINLIDLEYALGVPFGTLVQEVAASAPPDPPIERKAE